MPFPASGLALLCVEVIPASVISFPYHTHSTYCMLAGKHAMGYRKCLTDTIKATTTQILTQSHTPANEIDEHVRSVSVPKSIVLSKQDGPHVLHLCKLSSVVRSQVAYQLAGAHLEAIDSIVVVFLFSKEGVLVGV